MNVHLYIKGNDNKYLETWFDQNNMTKKNCRKKNVICNNPISTFNRIDKNANLYDILAKSIKSYPKAYILILNENYVPTVTLKHFNKLLCSISKINQKWDIFYFNGSNQNCVPLDNNVNYPRFYKVKQQTTFDAILISPSGCKNILLNQQISEKNLNKFMTLSLGNNIFIQDPSTINSEICSYISYYWFILIVIISIFVAYFLFPPNYDC